MLADPMRLLTCGQVVIATYSFVCGKIEQRVYRVKGYLLNDLILIKKKSSPATLVTYFSFQ